MLCKDVIVVCSGIRTKEVGVLHWENL